MPRTSVLVAMLVASGVLASGCGGKIEGDGPGTRGDNSGSTDGSGTDGGGTDGGGTDGGGTDGGGTDGGGPGGTDGGGTDGGGTDGGGTDGGGADGGGADGGGTDGGGADGGGTDGGDADTVYAIQRSKIAEGEPVTLWGVVATSGVNRSGEGFYVQDEGGGAWSGVYVYVGDMGAAALGIEEGLAYNISGYVTEYYGLTEVVVEDSATVEAAGGPAPGATIDTVSPGTVADWELWEGCLIDLGEVTVSEVSAYGEALVDGGVWIDNAFVDFDLSAGDVVQVSGVLDYSFDEWRIYPRSDADLAVDGGASPGATVYEVQTGAVAEGERVDLDGVVATSGLNSSDSGFFVQDPGGGSYSGVYVYLSGGAGSLDIEPGDVLSISGEVAEYYDLTEIVVGDPADVSETGSASVTVDAVDPAAVGDWEEWEGCLVSLGAVRATGIPNKYGQTETNAGLLVDDLLYDYMSGVAAGTIWSDLTGLIGYTFEEWVIYPRSADDL